MVECITCPRDGFASEKGMKKHHAMAHGESIAGVEIICAHCGSTTYRQRTEAEQADNTFCSTGCLNEWRAETSNGGLVGENHPNYVGSREYKCVNCGETFEVVLSDDGDHRSRVCSGECYSEYISSKNDHLSNYWSGEDNPRWSGGKASYYGENWHEKRRATLARDGHECVDCGLVDDLHVHHITPVKEFGRPEAANTDENLVTLCRQCHAKWEGIPVSPRVMCQ